MGRVHPTPKLILGMTGLLILLLSHSFFLLLAEAAVLAVAAGAVLPVSRLVQIARIGMPTVGMVFLVGWLTLELSETAFLCLRLGNLLIGSGLFFQLLEPRELQEALDELRVPPTFSFILMLALRYVPFMGRRIKRITEAQISRGIDLRPRLRNLPHFTALVLPLLIQAFLLSEELALALESRGFGTRAKPAPKRVRIALWEYGLLGLGFLGLMGVVCWS